MTEEQFIEVSELKRKYEEQQRVYEYAMAKEQGYADSIGLKYYDFNLMSIDAEAARSILAAYVRRTRKDAHEAEKNYIEALNRFQDNGEHRYGIEED